METQLERVKAKRKERLESERLAAQFHGGQTTDRPPPEIRQGERKKDKLKKEIEHMWLELETTYNNNELTEMENTLKADKLELLHLYQETQGQAKVRSQQNSVIQEKEGAFSKIAVKKNKF